MKKNQWVPTWLLYLAHARDDTWNRKPFSAVHRMVVKCGSPRLRQSLKDQQTTSINIYVRTTHGDILEAYLHWQPNTWDRRHEQEILSTEQAKYMNAAGELKRTQDHSIFMPKNTTPKIKKRREKNVIIEFKLQNPRRYLRFNYYLINSIIKTMIMFINASHLHFLHCIVHEQTKRKEEENQKWTEWFCRANLQFSAVWWICLDTVKHICEAQTRFTCVFEMAKKKMPPNKKRSSAKWNVYANRCSDDERHHTTNAVPALSEIVLVQPLWMRLTNEMKKKEVRMTRLTTRWIKYRVKEPYWKWSRTNSCGLVAERKMKKCIAISAS